jgi:diacylglycerol kinase
MRSGAKKFIKRFGYAFEGIRSAMKEQVFGIFCIVAVLVIASMILFRVSLFEKIVLVLTVTMVMTLELINSRIERIVDIFQPEKDPDVKIIKDISAAAVLIACCGAVIVGILIFWPYLRALCF